MATKKKTPLIKGVAPHKLPAKKQIRVVRYTVEQFKRSFRDYLMHLEGSSPHDAKHVRNAVHESGLANFRVLTDFLYPPTRPEPDDLLATHMIKGWQLRSADLPKPLRYWRAFANKMLMHPTTARFMCAPKWEKRKPLHRTAMLRELSAAWEVFRSESDCPDRLRNARYRLHSLARLSERLDD